MFWLTTNQAKSIFPFGTIRTSLKRCEPMPHGTPGAPLHRFADLVFYALLAVAVLLGAYLRLDQFSLQILIDDEWHAVHQLLSKQPKELFLTFGRADFSIPLSLLYWLESRVFGLNELAMRWPMMLAGISIVGLFPLYCRQFFSDRGVIIFAFLLAWSPLLIIYSRTARPYALTLLLAMVALVAFFHYLNTNGPRWRPALVYGICASLSCWLHLISAPLVIAPFLIIGVPALLRLDAKILRLLLYLGLPSAILVLLMVLPPLISHPEALTAKIGVRPPAPETFYGVLYFWLGTSSMVILISGLIFSVAGIQPLFRHLPIVVSLLWGLALTLLLIVMTQPAWIHHPLTLARYLLAGVPLALLALSLGIDRIFAWFELFWGKRGTALGISCLLPLFYIGLLHFPLKQFYLGPNSNTLHSVYQFDFRREHNFILHYQQNIPVSPFWETLSSLSADSLKISAAPFYFESYNWDAARWEQISNQRVMPGYLNKFCTKDRWGEVPDSEKFEFTNVGYVGDIKGMAERGFDLIAFQRPYFIMWEGKRYDVGKETENCELALRDLYPPAIYEDKYLLVFPVTEQSALKLHAQR